MVRLVAGAADGARGAVQATIDAELCVLGLVGDECAQTAGGAVQQRKTRVDIASLRRLCGLRALLGLRAQARSQNEARDYANT